MVIHWKYYRIKTVRVRLANIDAPEKKQPFGRWSASQLKDLVAGKPVTVQYLQTDRYNRILGRVYTADGTEANREQIRKGAAWYTRTTTRTILSRLSSAMPVPLNGDYGQMKIRCHHGLEETE